MGDASTPAAIDGSPVPVSEPVQPAVSLVPASVRLRRPGSRRNVKGQGSTAESACSAGPSVDLTAELAAAVPAFAASVPRQELQPPAPLPPQLPPQPQQLPPSKQAKLTKSQRRRLRKKEAKQAAALQDQRVPAEAEAETKAGAEDRDEDEDEDVVLLTVPSRDKRNISARTSPNAGASAGVGPVLLTPW